MLFVRNADKPGFIGRFGTLMGEAGVNIATFNLGRDKPGGDAICIVAVDEPVSDDVLAKVRGAAAGGARQPAAVLREGASPTEQKRDNPGRPGIPTGRPFCRARRCNPTHFHSALFDNTRSQYRQLYTVTVFGAGYLPWPSLVSYSVTQ